MEVPLKHIDFAEIYYYNINIDFVVISVWHDNMFEGLPEIV